MTSAVLSKPGTDVDYLMQQAELGCVKLHRIGCCELVQKDLGPCVMLIPNHAGR